MAKLYSKHNAEGYGVFFRLFELLCQNDGIIDYDLEMLSIQMAYDKSEVIKSVIEDFGLFKFDDELITSDEVFANLKRITDSSNRNRNAANVRWGKEKGEESSEDDLSFD